MHVWSRLKPNPGFERQSNCTFSCKDSVTAGMFNAQRETWDCFGFFYFYRLIFEMRCDALCWGKMLLLRQENLQRGEYVLPGRPVLLNSPRRII